MTVSHISVTYHSYISHISVTYRHISSHISHISVKTKAESGQNKISGKQTLTGRFVIVQMDNGEDELNLKEVKAFGEFEKSKFNYLIWD